VQFLEVAVNQFSVSLEFPDERQDEFRGRPGLHKHLAQTLHQLAKLGFRDLLLDMAMNKANLREMVPLVKRGVEWDVDISYTAYAPFRTKDEDYCLSNEGDLTILRQTIDELAALRRAVSHIANTEAILTNTIMFLEQGYLSDCGVGIRSLVAMSSGSLVPCSMHRTRYVSHKKMPAEFSKANKYNNCYCGLRSYSELSFLNHIRSITHYTKRLFAWNT
jgi:MoaA/NifB/PqqE/SkfB family radical SAM enzyme